MNYTITTFAARPDLRAAREALNSKGWPAFMLEDPVANRYWDWLYSHFAEYQLLMLDTDGQLVAEGNSIPVPWAGTPEQMGDGWDWAIAAGVRSLSKGPPPTTLCALAITIDPAYRGQALSTPLVAGMKQLAATHSLDGLIAPVRPSLKSLYPLTEIRRYVTWRQADGAPFDPWLRVHWRVGGVFLGVAPRSMVIPGTVAEWEGWTGLHFPDSGPYVVPGALTPIMIDQAADQGLYVEPNVWVWHAPDASSASTPWMGAG